MPRLLPVQGRSKSEAGTAAQARIASRSALSRRRRPRFRDGDSTALSSVDLIHDIITSYLGGFSPRSWKP
jgi:hypothetical protein